MPKCSIHMKNKSRYHSIYQAQVVNHNQPIGGSNINENYNWWGGYNNQGNEPEGQRIKYICFICFKDKHVSPEHPWKSKSISNCVLGVE